QIAQEYWKSTDIGIVSWSANTTHIVVLVQNNLPQTVNLTGIEIDGQLSSEPNVLLTPGGTSIVTMDATWDAATQGDLYEAEINFLYTDVETQTGYTFYGQAPLTGQMATTQTYEGYSGPAPASGDGCIDCVRGSGTMNYIPVWTSSTN